MKILELLAEKKMSPPKKSQCSSGKKLSNVRRAQCVARGWLAHDSDHCDGSGTQGVKGSCKPLRGRKVKSQKYGGPLKLYPGGGS